MACAVPDKIKDDYVSTEDMLQISEATANFSSCSTSSPLEEICGTDSRKSDEGNDELPPKVCDFSSLASSTSESQEYARACHVKDLGYDPEKHTDPPTKKIKDLSIKVALLSEEKEVLQEELDKSNLTMAKHLKKVSPKICDRFQLQQAGIEKKQLKDKVASMQDEINDLASELEKSGIENDLMKDKLASVNATSTLVEDLESQKAALDDEVKQLSEKNRTLYTNVYEAGFKHLTDLTNIQKEKDELQIKLSSKEAERCQLQAWLDEAYEKTRILENQNESAVNEAQRQQNPGEASEVAVECEGAARIVVRKDSVDIYNASNIKVQQLGPNNH